MSAEGGIRGTLFVGVPGYPSYAFSGGLTYVNVHVCSLMVVGVPVKLHRMTWRQESNHGPRACCCLLLLSVCFNCALIACTCVLLFPSACWRCYIVATCRGFGICGVMVVLLLFAPAKDQDAPLSLAQAA